MAAQTHFRETAARSSVALAIVIALGGCQTTSGKRDFDPVLAQFFVETAPQDPTARVIALPRSGVQIPVTPRVVLSEGDVANVELVRVDLGLCLMFEFGYDAARSLMRISSSNLGRRFVVTLNGRAFGARLIDGPIADGKLLIFVELPDDELTQIAVDLKRTAHEIQSAVARGKR